VLFGKHIDKIDVDSNKNIHTLPVILGTERALQVARALMIGFYITVVLEVALGVLSFWTLLVFLSIPRLRMVLKTFSEERPAEKPDGFPIWPLWYVAWAFSLTRVTGALFTVGLILAALF
jgi:1,4-dihydroxy-2-naphthoate octaprenyltransferase